MQQHGQIFKLTSSGFNGPSVQLLPTEPPPDGRGVTISIGRKTTRHRRPSRSPAPSSDMPEPMRSQPPSRGQAGGCLRSTAATPCR